MESKEEILKRHLSESQYQHPLIGKEYDLVYAAMEEYRNQPSPPEQVGKEYEGGWKYEPEWLKKLTESVNKLTDYEETVSMEQTEAVLMAINYPNKSEVGKEAIEMITELRNYFGEHDKTPQEHRLFSIADNLYKLFNLAEQAKQEAPGDEKDRQTTVVTLLSGKTISVDIEISELVQFLNDNGYETIASCCGHGFQPPRISLKDKRELVLLTFDMAQKIDKLFPGINGEPTERDELIQSLDHAIYLLGLTAGGEYKDDVVRLKATLESFDNSIKQDGR